MVSEKSIKVLKVTSLVTLTLQNAVLGLSMRYARTRSGPMFLSSTAVVMSEIVKLITCLFLVYKQNNYSCSKWISCLHNTVIRQPMDTLKVSVPSFVYIIQNNLLFVSASHLDAATYQVTYQLKILTTAIFAVLILKKSLVQRQWIALVVLVAGVALVQLSGSEGKSSQTGQNKITGFAAAIGACVLSGFAGIYFEMILKGSNEVSIWMRNVQLSFLSLPFGLLISLTTDSAEITAKGWLYGYDFFIWYLVVLQAGGGLIVAIVVKYADNILKGFATSLAIVISCICSMYFFNFQLTFMFILGAFLVITSIFLYSQAPPAEKHYSPVLNKEKTESV